MIDYSQTIFRSLFKEFIFDEETMRIEPRFQEYVSDELIQIGMNECGYSKERAMNHIQEVLDSVSEISGFIRISKDLSCCLSDLQHYSIMRFRHDGISLTLLYLEGSKFCLLKDDGHFLQPGDVLQCWSYILSEGSDVVFRVARDGRNYPDERHVMILRHIEAVEKFEPAYLSFSVGSDNDYSIVNAKNAIRSWQPTACDKGYVFMPQHFTTNKEALFDINLKTMRFSLNSDFDQSLYHGTDNSYLDILKMVCEYTEEADIEKRRRTIMEGKLAPIIVNGNQYALQVLQKARITL